MGIRSAPVDGVRLDISAYRMIKQNDIITYVDAAGGPYSTNAGETSHSGLEIGLTVESREGIDLSAGYSYAVHRFESWQPSSTTDFSGNEMNVTDERYAGRATYHAFRGQEYAPGMPRSLYMGLRYRGRSGGEGQ